jgi:hypothetical protein
LTSKAWDCFNREEVYQACSLNVYNLKLLIGKCDE